MRIDDVEWTLDRIEPIARHRITPEEVEEVFVSAPFFKRGRGGVYEAWGRTETGRCLLVIFRYLGHNRAWPLRLVKWMKMKKDISARNSYRRSRKKLVYVKSVAEIPDFKSDDEIADWYQTHSTVLIQDQLETLPAKAGRRLRSRLAARRANEARLVRGGH